MNQPGRAFLNHAQQRDGRVRLVQSFHTAEFLDVFGRLFFSDIEHVVLRDDPDQHIVRIDHRQRRAIVFPENVERFFLRFVHRSDATKDAIA